MNYDYPKFYDDNADYPQFPELTELKLKKRNLLKRATEDEETYRRLTHKKIAGNKTVNDQQANIERVMNGEDLPDDADIDTQLNRVSAQYSARLEAVRLIDIKILEQKQKAAQKVCDDLRPDHAKIMKRLCAALVEAHNAHAELWAMERALINNGIGLRGICNNRPTFLGIPVDRTGELASFFRQAFADKHITALPKEFK
jgi:hypothetical protein